MTGFFIIIAAALVITGGAYVTYRIVFRSPEPGQNEIRAIPSGKQYQAGKVGMLRLIDELDERPFEQVYITSHDGLRLAARYYHSADGAPLDIEMHGYRGTAIRDFCGGAKLALSQGHNVLLIDERACGKSEGRTITFGVEERRDCLDWISYALERFGPDVRILLFGVSMGAATVLMVSALELPESVMGIAADSAYTAPEDIIRKVCRDMRLPDKLIYPLIRLGARLFGGFDPNAASALEAVRKCRVPVLVIHGEDDRFVPCEMGRALYEACASEKTLLTVPDAGHGLSYIVSPEKYRQTVTDWLNSIL